MLWPVYQVIFVIMKANFSFRQVLVLALLLCFMRPAMGQRWKLRRYEVGGGIGVTQVFGDIGGTINEDHNWLGLRDIKIDETRLAFPLNVRYRLDPVYALKVNGILAFANGSDANSRNDRNRYYKTILGELSVQGEYYFIGEERKYKSAAMFNRRGMLNNYMSFGAYGFAGVGAVYSRANVYLDPEQTSEVDDVRKNNIAAVVPFGLGLKYIIDDRWLLNAELGYRIAFSDYIEGYKQTRDSKHNDVYYFLQISVGYRLETTRRGLPIFLDKEYRAVKGRGRSSGNRNKPRSKREALE